MAGTGADGAAAIISHERKRSVELISFPGPAQRQTGKCYRATLGKLSYGHRHVPQRHWLSVTLRRLECGRIVPMREVFHFGSGFDSSDLFGVQLREHLLDKLVRVREDRNIHRREGLMIHAPSVGANAINRTMDDGLVRGFLRLRCAETQAKYAGEVEPIETDDKVRLFD